MNLKYFQKNYEKLFIKAKLVIFILCLPLISCFNNEIIEGERQDLYQQEMDKYLVNDGLNIKLSSQKTITSIQQVDNGPTHLFEHSKLESSLSKLWETNLINRGSISAPVFSNNNIYILDGSANLYSFNLDGDKNWMLSLSPSEEKKQKTHHSGGIAIDKNNLYVATGFGEFFSINLVGTIKWKKRFDSPFRGAPIYNNDKIFIVNSSDLAIAINKKGETIWTLEGATRPTLLRKGVSPALKNNKLVLPFSSGQLTVVRPNNGSEIWKTSFDQGNKGESYSVIGDFGGSPVIKSNAAFALSSSGQLLALNLKNGNKIWSLPVGSNSTPLINGGSIFIVSTKGKLVRIDEKNGKVIWSRNISKPNISEKFFGPTLAGNFLWIAGTDGYLRKFNPFNGKQILQYRLGSRALYRPFAVHNRLFIVTKSGKIIAFN